MSEPTEPKYPKQPPKEVARPRLKVRATVRKFHGDDTSGEPFETVVSEDEGFAELVKEIEKNAPTD